MHTLIITFLFLLIISFKVSAQTQDDFMNKLTEVYMNVNDEKKALELAKELYQMAEKKKELQTYTNYLMMQQIFENQAKDAALAKACKEKADKLMAEMVGNTNTNTAVNTGGDALSQWNAVYYPALFSTTDPDNASKALNFLTKNPSLQNFNNYTWIAYAFERNGDFRKAKENYEKAQRLTGNLKEEFHTFSYYTNFLSRSGDYLKAEEFIQKMEKLSSEANEMFRSSYKSEAATSKMVYYLSIGDYNSYFLAAEEQYNYMEKLFNKGAACDPFPMIRFTYGAFAKEMLKEYKTAEALWKQRDSAHYAWIECNNKQYPNNIQYPLSMLPVYYVKTGKKSSLKQPLSYYIKETETHYNSYSQYADISINYMKAQHLGFLGSPQYHEQFKTILDHIVSAKDFREATLPFSNYAYFTMRDRQYEKSKSAYDKLFKLNTEWINDVIFTFGEKAFITYYNSRLKEGYDNYHSFVKIAKEKQSENFPALVAQAYNNLLFTKSISLKGTQKRKQAFLKANDPAIHKMYDEWIAQKQELIRLYQKTEDPSGGQKTGINQEQLKKLQEEVNHLENELSLKAKDFKKYLKITPVDWKSVRDQLKEGEAAVEIIRFRWRDQIYYSDTAYYAAYIITKTSQYPEVVYLSALASELDNRYYKSYQNNIKYKLEDKDSYNQYWKPIKDQLNGIKKIYFSPDGIYHLINISTLSNPDSKEYLLDELEIQYITGSNDVSGDHKADDIQNAVLIGRPSYKMNTDGKTLVAVSDNNTRSFVRSFRDNAVNDLPGTEVEVMTIKSEMDKYRFKVNYFIKDHATEDKVYTLQSPDILHIATHGYWSQAGYNATEGYRVFNAMVNSGLLMSGVINYYSSAEFPDTYDGILTAYEAQNLNLENTSLVVLSACETSLGHFDAGEGVYGLQRAFRAAGAKSIMTSLWKVDDDATKEFMILFYQHYLKTNHKFEAFRHAQKNLKLKYPDPYYWGAFILTGI
ncbi:MAG: CHAT domain-containing protein [Cytophagaceae bacterium]|nr:CHAT domain-containing protein [Cytophagaceae bacterium]